MKQLTEMPTRVGGEDLLAVIEREAKLLKNVGDTKEIVPGLTITREKPLKDTVTVGQIEQVPAGAMGFLGFKKLYSDARLPTRNHAGDAGLDLYAYFNDKITRHPYYTSFDDGPGHFALVIPPGKRVKIGVGVATELPYATFGKLEAKSGQADDYGVEILGGVIDSPYRGEIKAIVKNGGDEPLYITHGDPICQMVVHPVLILAPRKVDVLLSSDRSESGFGSRGTLGVGK